MAEPGEPLTERELAVLELLAGGSTNREIAQDLHISPNTVKVHVRNIFTKLEVSSRTEASTAAIQSGLLSLPGTHLDEITEETKNQSTIVQESRPVELTEQDPDSLNERPALTHWRWIALILIVLVVLLIGTIAGVMITRNDASNALEETTVSDDSEPFVEQPLGEKNWYAEQPLPRSRAGFALASVGLDLYVIGGEVDAGVVNLVNVYETDGHQWRSAASKPTAVADATAAVLFGEIFVPGGRLADNRPTAVVEAFSPANNAWRPVSPLPKPVAGGLTLSDGNLLYLIGGWDGENYLNEVFVYDPVADVWQELNSMNLDRANATGGVVDSYLYVVGGRNDEKELAACEFFDPNIETWSECPEMAQSRAGASATVLGNNQLYVIGGGKEHEVLFSESYDSHTQSWKRFEMPLPENGGSWHDLGVTSVETRIYALGGRQDDTLVPLNYVYNPLIFRTFLPTVGDQD